MRTNKERMLNTSGLALIVSLTTIRCKGIITQSEMDKILEELPDHAEINIGDIISRIEKALGGDPEC